MLDIIVVTMTKADTVGGHPQRGPQRCMGVLQLSMVYNRGTHTWQGQAKNPSKQRTPEAAWPWLESQTDPALNGLGNKRNLSSCLTIAAAATPEELNCTRAAGEAASSPDHTTSGQQTYSTCQELPHCK